MHVHHKYLKKNSFNFILLIFLLFALQTNKPAASLLIFVPTAGPTIVATIVQVGVLATFATKAFKETIKLPFLKQLWQNNQPNQTCHNCKAICTDTRKIICNNGPRCQCGCGCFGRCGCSCGCGCDQPIQIVHGNNSNPIDLNKPRYIFEKNAHHMFRNDGGHLPDTPENRKLLLDLSNDPKNYFGTDKWNNHWFGKTLPNGKQVWASVRNNYIRNCGLNVTPNCFNTETGLSSLKG